MSDQVESKTLGTLMDLFARESMTLIRYRRFASTASHEGFASLATALERLIQTQTVLVEGHFDLLRNVGDPVSHLPLGSTLDNLRAARASEDEECRHLYPSAARTAEAEGFASIAGWLHTLTVAKQANVDKIDRVLREANKTVEKEN